MMNEWPTVEQRMLREAYELEAQGNAMLAQARVIRELVRRGEY